MRAFIRLLSLAVIATSAAQDLPYDSGSDGSDGAFSPAIPPGMEQPRFLFAATFDSVRNETLVYGGGSYANFPFNVGVIDRRETVTWDGNAWETASTSGGPSRNYLGGMAFDSANGIAHYYGGRTANSGTITASHYTWDGSSWTLLEASAAPGARGFMPLAYDEARSRLILYGGVASGASFTSATWLYDGTSWANASPATSPPARRYHALCYDAKRQEIVLFGGEGEGSIPLNDTWVWDGTTWTQRSPATVPPVRLEHAIGYDPATERVILHGGIPISEEIDEVYHSDTWAWDGTDWTEVTPPKEILNSRRSHEMVTDTTAGQLLLIGGLSQAHGHEGDLWRWDGVATEWVPLASDYFRVPMSDRPDGVWNYTDINIPEGVTVEFIPNENNTPVTWLASGDVTIEGSISVDGHSAVIGIPAAAGSRAPGGPGGGAGGIGGTRPEVFGTTLATPGFGAGGGTPGFAGNGGEGLYEGVYGNPFILPLLGGSGGGGGGAVNNVNGGNGGGGGGALLIASSRDISLEGELSANGGYRSAGNRLGGNGSGGAIKLVADRILGSGTISVSNGANSTASNRGGYVRLESFLRPFDISGTMTAATAGISKTAPVEGVTLGPPPILSVTSVDGENVAATPSGSFSNPDVIFSEAGDVTVTVSATAIPDGTPVTLKGVFADGSSASLPEAMQPDVLLDNGTATFTLTVPAGFGTFQAFATYDVSTDAP